ncbi:hypothetical protein QC761_204360 [Podospora bellae-mahoneyi]|uniref:DUF7730 domain-containing protein n=1 Tax=Podospora bellae-mahoneyi TaxID=2093777 RepID=A0ABR0FRU6_9PEZI|nr:hypothetical protein QC761_204360 [Podospora bellae-mahoneyi]
MADRISDTEAPSGITASRLLDQLESPLFGKLPAELRAVIYTEIFGGQRIHLNFTTHPIRADRVGLRKRWRHAICEEPVAGPFSEVTSRQHHCFLASRRRVLDINLLFTCQRVFEEGIPILYQSNTFHIVNIGTERLPSDDLRSLQVKIPKNWGLIRSLEFKWEVNIFDRNHPRFVPHHWGRDGYEAFWDGLADMPLLSQLRISIIMPQILMLASPEELRKLYFEPITRLKHLRICEVILPRSYSSHFGMSPEDQRLPIDGDGNYRISWATVDDGRPLAAAAANPASIQLLRTATSHTLSAPPGWS